MSGRNPKVLGVWGPQGTRVVASEAQWKLPPKWNREAEAAGERRRVFCASLADVFEGRDTMPEASWPLVQGARARLMGLIASTPMLDWLLLTKRPGNVLPILRGLPLVDGPANDMVAAWSEGKPPANVWLGTSVEDHAAAEDRVPHLLAVPSTVRFLSCEPLLGSLDLRRVRYRDGSGSIDALTGRVTCRVKGVDGHPDFDATTLAPVLRRIDWVIVGGESGHRARPFVVDDAREILAQCRDAGTPAFCKQLGAEPRGSDAATCQRLVMVTDPKGGDPEEWPDDLRIREFPAQGG